jgi:hypothetical protein
MRDRIVTLGDKIFGNSEPNHRQLVMSCIKRSFKQEQFSDKWYFAMADAYIASVYGQHKYQDNYFFNFVVDCIELRQDFSKISPYIRNKMERNEKALWLSELNSTKVIKRINYKTGEITKEVINV